MTPKRAWNLTEKRTAPRNPPARATFAYLMGTANHGLGHMFTMMNEARQKIGIRKLLRKRGACP